jgi:hypothetical protein
MVKGEKMMNRIAVSRQSRPTFVLAVMAILAVLVLGASQPAQAQWVANGSNISNTNSGNVGIGTSTPGAKLDVSGTTTIQRITNTDATGYGTLGFFEGSTEKAHLGFIGSGATPSYYVGGPSAFQIWNFANAPIVFGTNSAERVRIDGAGNLGIGTTGPGAKLEVQIPNAVTDGIKVTDAGAAGKFLYLGEGTSTSGVFSPYIATSSSANWGLLLEGGVPTDSSTLPAVSVRGNVGGAALANSPIFTVATTNGSELFRVGATGNVGIGKSNPSEALDVVGNIAATGNISAKYQDVAEWVPALHSLPAGTVVVLNPNESNQVMASSKAYDTGVAGVVSEHPGVALGEASKDKVLVATTGRVKVKVDATRAPVHVGDLLVTSDQEGVAMKSEPVMIQGRAFHSPGTLIGKALEPLEKGTGEILVLLSLQ